MYPSVSQNIPGKQTEGLKNEGSVIKRNKKQSLAVRLACNHR